LLRFSRLGQRASPGPLAARAITRRPRPADQTNAWCVMGTPRNLLTHDGFRAAIRHQPNPGPLRPHHGPVWPLLAERSRSPGGHVSASGAPSFRCASPFSDDLMGEKPLRPLGGLQPGKLANVMFRPRTQERPAGRPAARRSPFWPPTRPAWPAPTCSRPSVAAQRLKLGGPGLPAVDPALPERGGWAALPAAPCRHSSGRPRAGEHFGPDQWGDAPAGRGPAGWPPKAPETQRPAQLWEVSERSTGCWL